MSEERRMLSPIQTEGVYHNINQKKLRKMIPVPNNRGKWLNID